MGAGDAGKAETPEGRAASSAPASALRVQLARAYAARRAGRVSFAVTDTAGRGRGFRADAPFITASVVKAMLLVAELERMARTGQALTPALAAQHREMIQVSDNDAATAVYRRVGDAGLRRLARRAGMRGFRLGARAVPSCRCSGNGWARAQITASDQARFMRALDRLLPARFRRYGRTVLLGIAPSQRWGIPEGAGPKWRAYVKNGVRTTGLGVLVHQVARLERGDDVVSIAVLTDGNPSEAYGKETIEELTRTLVGQPRAGRAP